MSLKPPDVPGYECRALLGEGAMGSVWRARQEGLGRLVAVKVLKPGVGGADARARLVREAAVMARARHPHLIELLDAGETPDGAPWLAMELVEGRSLEQALLDDGPLEVAEARRIMFEVADALEALHRLDLIHRDVKPGNIMLGLKGRAVLMDLGIARSVEHRDVTASGLVLGTLAFLSPEVLRGHPPEASDDWFAWGITWWQLLTGDVPVPPQEALAAAHAGRVPVIPAPAPIHGALPEEDRRVLRAATAPRGERPGAWPELRQAGAAPAPAGAPETRPVATPPSPGATTRDARPLPVGALTAPPSPPTRSLRAPLAGAALVLGGLLAYAVTRPPPPPEPQPTPLTPPPPLQATTRWRGPSDLLVHVTGTGGARPWAYRLRAGREEPVAVYASEGDDAWVWAAGLGDHESGAIRVELPGPSDRPGPPPATATFPASPGPPAPPPALPPDLPTNLRRVLTATREAHEAVMELEKNIPRRGARKEPWQVVLDEIKSRRPPTLAPLPPAAWRVVLSRLAQGGGQAHNLLRALRIQEPVPPAAVARQLIHLQVALATRTWLVGDWAVRGRMAHLALLHHPIPEDLVDLLEAWQARVPEAARGTYALANALARGHAVSGDGPLGSLLARRPRPTPADLEGFTSSTRLFAIALLGGHPEARRHVPWLLERYRTGPLPEARAADAALEELAFRSGIVWHCGPEGGLWMWGVGDDIVEALTAVPAEVVAVHRPELERVWVWTPEGAGRVSWRVGEQAQEHDAGCR